MKLNDLEFNAEDFAQLLYYMREECETPTATQLAELTNRLLRERLEKAPRVYSMKPKGIFEGLSLWGEQLAEGDSYTARLVCIEEIKKEIK